MQLYCGGCSLANHAQSPTHHIQVCDIDWERLKSTDLFAGMEQCILWGIFLEDIRPLSATWASHWSTMHPPTVSIQWWLCADRYKQNTQNRPWLLQIKQLLHHGWFPSMSTDPRTASTFQLLHYYQILSFESKVSAYEFYHSLIWLTDNTGMMKHMPVHLYLYMLLQFLIVYFRIIMTDSCRWFMSGGISQCWNVSDMVMIPVV